MRVCAKCLLYTAVSHSKLLAWAMMPIIEGTFVRFNKVFESTNRLKTNKVGPKHIVRQATVNRSTKIYQAYAGEAYEESIHKYRLNMNVSVSAIVERMKQGISTCTTVELQLQIKVY